MKFSVSSYKKTLLIAIAMLFSMSQSIFAQTDKPKNLVLYDTQPYHFGFIIAGNSMFYSLDYKENYQLQAHTGEDELGGLTNQGKDSYDFDSDHIYYTRSITPTRHVGFTVGVVGDLRLSKYFNLRLIPSLSFNTRVVSFDFYDETADNYFSINKEIFSTFMEFPLHVKYRSKRYNNVAAYVIAGGNFKLDLASQKKRDKSEGTDNITNIKVRRTDVAAEIGAGFDFYTYFFKLGIEAKMSWGLLNVMDPQGIIYDSSLNGVHNRMFQLSLTFE